MAAGLGTALALAVPSAAQAAQEAFMVAEASLFAESGCSAALSLSRARTPCPTLSPPMPRPSLEIGRARWGSVARGVSRRIAEPRSDLASAGAGWRAERGERGKEGRESTVAVGADGGRAALSLSPLFPHAARPLSSSISPRKD